MAEQIGAIRCGAFVAVPIGYNRWRITCDRLPEWQEEVEAVRDSAARAVVQLQAQFRNTWEVQK